MPAINLTTLSGIPGIDQTAVTQLSPNLSGAYATAAAVGAFGAFPQAAYLSYGPISADAPHVLNNAKISPADNFQQLSAAIYTITGILNNIIPKQPPINPCYIAEGGFNSPAAMARVIIELGRATPTINAQPVAGVELKYIYPSEIANCYNNVSLKPHINLQFDGYAPPAPSHTHIVLVNSLTNPHWVAQGSDGLFYDPADGSMNNNWGPISSYTQPMGPKYTFAGLWLVIS